MTSGAEKRKLCLDLGATAFLDYKTDEVRKVCAWLHEEKDLFLGHWLMAKEGIQNGTTPPCFCVDMTKAQEKERVQQRTGHLQFRLPSRSRLRHDI
jgi:hypothetical protein